MSSCFPENDNLLLRHLNNEADLLSYLKVLSNSKKTDIKESPIKIPANSGSFGDWTLLSYAVWKNFSTVTDFLLDDPSEDPNQKILGTKWVLLTYAVYYGYSKTTHALLKTRKNKPDVNPNITMPDDISYRGYTLLGYTLYKEYFDTATTLVETKRIDSKEGQGVKDGNKVHPYLSYSVYYGQERMVKCFIQHNIGLPGDKITIAGYTQWCLLNYAVYYKYERIAIILLIRANESDLNLKISDKSIAKYAVDQGLSEFCLAFGGKRAEILIFKKNGKQDQKGKDQAIPMLPSPISAAGK